MLKKRILYGTLFLAAAVFIILNQADVITADISVGHIALGVIFGCILIGGILERSFFGIFFSLAFLWIIFDEPLGFPDVSEWSVLFVALLLVLGFSALFPAKIRKSYKSQVVFGNTEDMDSYEKNFKGGKYRKVVEENEDGRINLQNHFGATSKHINVSDLKGAFVENSFGELKAYFDNVTIVEDTIDIVVDCSFGSVELYIPREWNVIQKVGAFAAGVTEKNPGDTAGKPIVNIVGNVSFGEVTIIRI